MRSRKEIMILFIVFCLHFANYGPIRQTVHAKVNNPLTIEKTFGLSTTPGTFRNPWGLAIAKDGSMYIADTGESQIEVYDANLKYRFSFGSIGSGDDQFQVIQQIRFDENDHLYVLDKYLNQIKIFNKDGTFIKKWGDSFSISSPDDFVFLNDQEIVIIRSDHVDSENSYVKVFTLDGKFIRDFIQDPDFLNPDYPAVFSDFAVDLKGYVYLKKYGIGLKADYLNFSPDGYFVCEYIKKEDLGEKESLYYMVFSGQYMFVTIRYAIFQYRVPDDPKEPLEFVEVFLNEIEYEPGKTCKLRNDGLICAQDKLFTFDAYHNRITIYSFNKQRIGFLQSPILECVASYGDVELPKNIFGVRKGIKIGPDKNLYIVNKIYDKVSVLNQNGEEINSISLLYNRTKKEYGSTLLPTGIVFDQLGYCYVSDIWEGSIHVFKPDLSPHMILKIPDNYSGSLAINKSCQLAISASTIKPWDFRILLYDISRIESKEITFEKTIDIENYYVRSRDIIFDDLGNIIVNVAWWVQDEHLHRSNKILWISPEEEIINKIDFDEYPESLCRDESGNIYTILEETNTIVKLTPEGQIVYKQKIDQCGLAYITSDNSGNLFVTDSYHNVVLVLSDKTVDKIPPSLKVNPIPQVVYDPILPVRGETEPEATVIVNQKEVSVDPKGFFEASIELQKGENTIHITAIGKAGNNSEFSQQVDFKERTIIQSSS